MITIKCTYDDGDTVTTGFNGTLVDARRYYVGQTFNVGLGPDDNIRTCVSVELVADDEEHATPNEQGLAASVERSPMAGVPMLRVGDLRRLISNLDDAIPVVIATDDWYVHVEATGVPLASDMSRGDYGCLTFFPGGPFDARDY